MLGRTAGFGQKLSFDPPPKFANIYGLNDIMESSQGLIPILSSAIVIGIWWKRDPDREVKIYNIKRKYWYAFMEAMFLITVLVLLIRKLN